MESIRSVMQAVRISRKNRPAKRFSLQHRIFLGVQLCVAGWSIYLWVHLPSPGWAVAILAGVAAAMSIHGEMKSWQKALWMGLIGILLVIELRAINKDRSDNAAVQTTFFNVQQEGFTRTADGLRVTINALNQTLEQTAPRALIGKPFINVGNAQIGPGTQFYYNITTTNSGNDTAHFIDTFSESYVGKPGDTLTQRLLTARFESAWRLRKPQAREDLPPGSQDLVTFYSPRFTLSDAQGIQAATLTLYTFVRTEYSDRTGTWYSDYCGDMQVPIQAAGVLSHACPIPTSYRYKGTKKK